MKLSTKASIASAHHYLLNFSVLRNIMSAILAHVSFRFVRNVINLFFPDSNGDIDDTIKSV